MTLTDREIAILHLALRYADGYQSAPSESGFDEIRAKIDQCEALSEDDECLFRALRMVPLYRHAFGIKEPNEILEEAGRDAFGGAAADAAETENGFAPLHHTGPDCCCQECLELRRWPLTCISVPFPNGATYSIDVETGEATLVLVGDGAQGLAEPSPAIEALVVRGGFVPEPSPASLAIANALSRMRP